jgi:N-acetylmuramoyl-L-alanine amidase
LSRTTLPHDWRPAPGIGERRDGKRPDILLLHYTGMASAEAACRRLCDPHSGVSCHYLVDEHGGIVQMVEEHLRAWHAGQSFWHGETDVNSRSIGIEIHNRGHEADYPDFPESQMAAVIALSRDILSRHAIAPERVLAHSDIAPRRKLDPGEKFDWRRLHEAGIGHWVEPESVGDDAGLGQGDESESVLALQRDPRGLRLRRAAIRHLRCHDRCHRDRLPAPLPPGPRRRPGRPFDVRDAQAPAGKSPWRLIHWTEAVERPI